MNRSQRFFYLETSLGLASIEACRARIAQWMFPDVKSFQVSFAWWELPVDDHVGIETVEAVDKVMAEKGRLSAHYHMDEFRSKATGAVVAHRELLRGLERLHSTVGKIRILHGYRTAEDEDRIRQSGGTPAANSQHKFGCAIDPVTKLDFTAVRGLAHFSGIGCQGSEGGPVRHLDVRHAGPMNPGGATPGKPTIWVYRA